MTDDHRNAHKRLFRNATSQIGGGLLYRLTRLCLPPFILHYISLQEYGIWSTCFLILSYISMGTFGISGIYIRFSAEYYAKGEFDKIGTLLGAGIWLTLGISLLVMTGLWFAMPWIYAWFHIDPSFQDTALILIIGVIGAMLLDLMFPYAYVLQGIQRNAEQTAISTLSYLLETVLIVVFLWQGMGLQGLLLAFILRSIFALLVLLVAFKRIMPGFKIHFFGISKEQWRLFLNYGGVLQLVGIFSMFLNTCERALAGYVNKGVGAVGLLDIGQKFPVMTCQLFNAAANSLLSAITHLHSQGEREEVARLYLRSSRYLNLLNGLALGFMAPFAVALIVAWIGQEIPYEEAGLIMVYAAAGFHVQALTAPATCYFQAIKKPGRSFWSFILPQGLLFAAGLGWMLWHGEQSLLKVAELAMVARLISSVGVIFYANTLVGVGQFHYFRQVAWVGVLPYGLGYLLQQAVAPWLDWTALSRWEAIEMLAVLGTVYGLLMLGILYSFLCTRDEVEWARGRLGKFLPKSCQ